jgi:glucosamine-6-phosphate deaminase
MEAKMAILQLNGSRKAEVVRRLIDSEISPEFPASVIKSHLNSYMLLDKDAARYL